MADNKNTPWLEFLNSEEVRKASREAERVLREEFTLMGVNLHAVLKTSLNVEAALREALNSSALRSICQEAGAVMAKGLRLGLGTGGGKLPSGGAAAGAQEALDVVAKTVGALLNTAAALNVKWQAMRAGIGMEDVQGWVGAAKAIGLEFPIGKLSQFFERLNIELAKARKNPSHPLVKYGLPLDDPQKTFVALADKFRTLQADKVQELAYSIGLTDPGIVLMLRKKSSEELRALVEKKRGLGGYTEKHAQVAGEYQEAVDDFFQTLIPITAGMQAAAQSWLTPKIRQGTETVMLAREGKTLEALATGLPLAPGDFGKIARQIQGIILLTKYLSGDEGKQRLQTGLGNVSAAMTATSGNVLRQRAEGAEQVFSGVADTLANTLSAAGDLSMWLVKLSNLDKQGMGDKARDLWGSLAGLGGAALDIGEGMLKTYNPFPWLAPDASALGSGEEAQRLAEMHATGALTQGLGRAYPWIPQELLQNMLDTAAASVHMAATGAGAFGPSELQPPVTHETTVNVGEVTVNTRATDAWAISMDIAQSLTDVFPRQIVNASDTGVAR